MLIRIFDANNSLTEADALGRRFVSTLPKIAMSRTSTAEAAHPRPMHPWKPIMPSVVPSGGPRPPPRLCGAPVSC
jgi:hypothetical protein